MDSWEERTEGQAGASQQHQQQQQQRPGMLRLNPTAPTFNFNPGASTFAPSWGPPPPAFAVPPAYGAPQFPAAAPAPPARPPATYGEPPAAARPPPFVLSDEERRSLQAAAASSSNSGTHLPHFGAEFCIPCTNCVQRCSKEKPRAYQACTSASLFQVPRLPININLS